MKNDPQEIQICLQMHLRGTSSISEYLDAHVKAIVYCDVYTKYQLLQKLWKSVIYKVVQEKRVLLKDPNYDVSELTCFINYVVGWFSLVLTRLTINSSSFPIVFHCYLYMGDLARYKDQAIRGNMVMSKECYKQAELLYPQNGLVHHQIAVVATLLDQDLEALYHYIRSLYGFNSPEMAGGNLRKFLEKKLGLKVPFEPPSDLTISKCLLYLIKVNMNQTDLKSVYLTHFLCIFKKDYKQLAQIETMWIVLICSVLPDNDALLIQLLNLVSQLEFESTTRLLLLLLVGKHLHYVPPTLQKYVGKQVVKPSIFLSSDYLLLGFVPLNRAFQILDIPYDLQTHEQAMNAKEYFESHPHGILSESLEEWINFLLKEESSDEDELVLYQDPESQLKKLAERTVTSLLDIEDK